MKFFEDGFCGECCCSCSGEALLLWTSVEVGLALIGCGDAMLGCVGALSIWRKEGRGERGGKRKEERRKRAEGGER
jgi:hypothetical protein